MADTTQIIVRSDIDVKSAEKQPKSIENTLEKGC